MKYLVYVAIAIFTFAVGVGISPIRFYGESTACGPRSSSIAYRSSYFMQTSFSYIEYESEQEAKDAFHERLKKAVKVIDLSPKVNKRGVLIEQRAVGIFYNEGTEKYYVQAFWRDEKTLYFISSRSYTHVKEFERQQF